MCVLTSRKRLRWCVGGVAASSGDVSPQMGLAGKWSRAGCSHNCSSCACGEKPGQVGGAGEDPHTPGSLPQRTRPRWRKPVFARPRGHPEVFWALTNLTSYSWSNEEI